MSVELKPVKPKKIYQEIVDQIQSLILEGELKPGDRLPSEKKLAESFQVCRASLREAMRALEITGVIEMRAGGGASIKLISPPPSPLLQDSVLEGENYSWKEKLEVRRILEMEAVQQVAERITEKDLKELELLLARSASTAVYYAAFHSYIIRMTHNQMTIFLMTGILQQLPEGLQKHLPDYFQEGTDSVLIYMEHKCILEALRSKNKEAAREAMAAHLQRMEDGMNLGSGTRISC